MLEIRKGTASRGYENIFFREFSYNLSQFFKKHNKDGLLIGFSEIEESPLLQIDALLITDYVVCVIDFKNFGGKITLPHGSDFQKGGWKHESGEYIKGGSSLSPFEQLNKQVDKLGRLYNDYIKNEFIGSDIFDPKKIRRIVCFQDSVQIDGDIPGNLCNIFGIIDKTNYLERISDYIGIKNNDISLSKSSYETFKKFFRADVYNPAEEYGVGDTVNKSMIDRHSPDLHSDQKIIMSDIEKFLLSDSQVFVMSGASGTGKSFLIPEIQHAGYSSGFEQIDVLAYSQRIAHNLSTHARGYQVNSLYSYLYSGIHQDDSDENEGDEFFKEIISLRNNDNAEKTLYIIDEAHLVSDSLFDSDDIRFGSGRLLQDFFEFVAKKSNYKIIFIGDPYLLQHENSSLNIEYLASIYKIQVEGKEMLMRKSESSIQNLSSYLIDKIIAQDYSRLEFQDDGDNIHIIKDDKSPGDVLKNTENDFGAIILTYSNKDASSLNYWIKEKIVLSGKDIGPKDRVMLLNQVNLINQEDPFGSPIRLHNGAFGIIHETKNREEHIVKLKDVSVSLFFREVTFFMEKMQHPIVCTILENTLLNEKGELTSIEKQAYHVFLGSLAKQDGGNYDTSAECKALQNSAEYQTLITEILSLKKLYSEGEKVKGKLDEKEKELRKLDRKSKKLFNEKKIYTLLKDPTTEYYKYKNAVKMQFGWAITVHKTFSFKWNTVIFNMKYSQGKQNKEYFRWLYTGISRTNDQLFLVNYVPITPWDNIELIDVSQSGRRIKDYLLISEYKDPEQSVTDIIKYITGVLGKNFSVIKDCIKGFEIFIKIIHGTQRTELSFYFDKKGRAHYPNYKSGNQSLFEDILAILKHREYSLNNLKDEWKKNYYQRIANKESSLKIIQIEQISYCDVIKIRDEQGGELDIESRYDGKNRITSIKALYYSDIAIWNKFQTALYAQE